MFLEYSNTRLIVASSNLSSSQEYNSTKTKRRQRFDFDDAILMCCFIVTAALTLISDFDHYTILGTSLISVGPAAFDGTLTHYKAKKLNMRVTPFLAMGTLVGAFAGGKIGLQVDEVSLRHGFSAMILTFGVRTILKA